MKAKSKKSRLKIEDALMFGQRAHNMGISNKFTENEDYYLKPTPLYMMGKKRIQYQFFAEVGRHCKEESKNNIFEFCVLETVKWLIQRFGDFPAPKELEKQLENNCISSLHCEGGCNIDIAYAEETNEKHWAIYFSEPDPGTPFRFPQPGSIFQTNIAYYLKDDKISCAFRTISIQPDNADFEMEVFRPNILNQLSDKFGFDNASRPIKREAETNLRTSKMEDYIKGKDRILPIILVKDNDNDLDKINAELLAKTLFTFAHVYIVSHNYDFSKLNKNINRNDKNECAIFFPYNYKKDIIFRTYTKDEILSHEKVNILEKINPKQLNIGYKYFETVLIDEIINKSREFYNNESNLESKKEDVFYTAVYERELEVLRKYGNLSVENRLELVTSRLQKIVACIKIAENEKVITNELIKIRNNSNSLKTCTIEELLIKFTGIEQLLIHGKLTYSLMESALLGYPEQKIPIAVFQPLANAVEVYLRQKIYLNINETLKKDFIKASVKIVNTKPDVSNLGGLLSYLKGNNIIFSSTIKDEDSFNKRLDEFNTKFRIPSSHTSDMLDMKTAKDKIEEVDDLLIEINKYIK